VTTALADIIEDYDIVAFQEIRDKKETALPNFINAHLRGYKYVVSPRLGRTSSKEQYSFIYRSDTMRVTEPTTYPDLHDVFEREPYMALVAPRSSTYEFVLVQVHTKPTDAENEIRALEDVSDYAAAYYGMNDIIILGDFNAGTNYFKRDTELEDHFWLISDDADTMSGSSHQAHDRVVTRIDFGDNIDCFVDNYEDDSLFGNQELILATSDHFPVFCEMRI
jgi:endonuclease/exonuclease/phosphatase family metal-dependent hydrolase